MTDEFYMQRCIQLARSGTGFVAPNPLVGAVLVFDNRIIGEGYHQQYGQAHAEVNCINSVKESDRDLIPESTLYVSLEPCSHFGKTPPCTDLILRQKIPSVKIGSVDIHDVVNGKGIDRLRQAGVEVKTGICEQECLFLNRRFFTSLSQNRPYIVLKWAQSSNGMMGKTGVRTPISNPYTNMLVHKWRKEEPAILVGHRTATIDNPQLTNRHWEGKQPVRILLCSHPCKEDLVMFSGPGKTIVFNTEENKVSGDVHFVKVSMGAYLSETMTCLMQENIQSVLVEGGAFTLKEFLDAGLWDEIRVITARRKIIDNGIPAPSLPETRLLKEVQIADDQIAFYGNPHNRFVVPN